jgi:hypothetical protein
LKQELAQIRNTEERSGAVLGDDKRRRIGY